MKSDSWVVLSSANGSTNLGDESMWEATVQTLRGLAGPVPVISDAHFGFESPLPNVSLLPFLHHSLRRGRGVRQGTLERIVSYPRRTEYAFERAVQQYRQPTSRLSQRWLDAISNAQGLIISGAGAMTDDYAPHGVASWWLATEWANAHSVPVHFVGQGIGPLLSQRGRRYAARMLDLATTVNVREAISAEVVRELGVRTPVSVTPDWAILNLPQPDDWSRANAIVEQWFGQTPFVALSLHRRHNTTRSDLASLSALTERLVELSLERDWGVAFVPNMTGKGYSDDRETFDQLSQGWNASVREHVRVVRDRVGPRVTRALLGRSEALFSTRYHPMVFALSEKTPSVGLSYDPYYDQKLAGVSTMFGMRGNVFRVADARAHKLLEAARFTPSEEGAVLAQRSVNVLAQVLP